MKRSRRLKYLVGGLALELYKALESGDDYLRDVAFESLWRLSTTGVRLPDPLKFGY